VRARKRLTKEVTRSWDLASS